MILLDTHIVLWLANEPERLSIKAADAIREAGDRSEQLALSAASIYEITWLMERGRLMLASGAQSFLDELNLRFAVLPIDDAIAVAAARIAAPFHGDPIDRLIVATALATKSRLITADRSILASNACKLIW